MTIDRNNTNTTLWVAIDISKLKHDVLIEYPNGSHKRLIIINDIQGFNKLTNIFNDSNLAVFIELEATGYYHAEMQIQHMQKNFKSNKFATTQCD